MLNLPPSPLCLTPSTATPVRTVSIRYGPPCCPPSAGQVLALASVLFRDHGGRCSTAGLAWRRSWPRTRTGRCGASVPWMRRSTRRASGRIRIMASPCSAVTLIACTGLRKASDFRCSGRVGRCRNWQTPAVRHSMVVPARSSKPKGAQPATCPATRAAATSMARSRTRLRSNSATAPSICRTSTPRGPDGRSDRRSNESASVSSSFVPYACQTRSAISGPSAEGERRGTDGRIVKANHQTVGGAKLGDEYRHAASGGGGDV